MTPGALLVEAQRCGAHLYIRDGRLRATQSASLTLALRQDIAAHSGEIAALIGTPETWPAVLGPGDEAAITREADRFLELYHVAATVRQQCGSGSDRAKETDHGYWLARQRLRSAVRR